MLLKLASTRLTAAADAEDAVQETFLRLVSCRPLFRDAEHEKAWLIRTTLHRACDLRRQAEAALENEAAPQTESDLLSAVRALPENYSAVIHLHYYEGYSIKEIAKLLRLPAATVGTRLSRGRDRLRQMLKEEA